MERGLGSEAAALEPGLAAWASGAEWAVRALVLAGSGWVLAVRVLGLALVSGWVVLGRWCSRSSRSCRWRLGCGC